MSDDPQRPRHTERRMQPQRLDDPQHILDAYPIKDDAQRERLMQQLQGDQPQDPDTPPDDAADAPV